MPSGGSKKRRLQVNSLLVFLVLKSLLIDSINKWIYIEKWNNELKIRVMTRWIRVNEESQAIKLYCLNERN